MGAPQQVLIPYIMCTSHITRPYNSVILPNNSTTVIHSFSITSFPFQHLPLPRLEQGTATYGPNMFADVTEEEFTTQYLSKIDIEGVKLTNTLPLAANVDIAAPAEMEWNNKGKSARKVCPLC